MASGEGCSGGFQRTGDGREALAMAAAGAECLKRFGMGGRAVALVLAEAIARIAVAKLGHRPVTGDLG